MTDKTNTMKLIIRGILAMFIAAPALVSAQDRYGETEEQQILCKEAISVYVSYKKQKNYDEAFIQWKKACDVCPPTAREGMYSDGVRFLKNELKKTEDEARTQALQDSIFLLYDQRMELFPSTSKKPNNRCRILAYKATDYYRLFKKDGAAVANAMFKESIDCLGAASSPATLSTYYVTSFYAMKRMEDDAEAKAKLGEMLTEYLTLMDYLDQGIATATAAGKADAVEDYTKAKGNLDEVFIAIAQCEDMVPVLSEKVAADSANFELKQKVLRLLNQKDCTDNDLLAGSHRGSQRNAEPPFSVCHWQRAGQGGELRRGVCLHGRGCCALCRLRGVGGLLAEGRKNRFVLGQIEHGAFIRSEGTGQ